LTSVIGVIKMEVTQKRNTHLKKMILYIFRFRLL
jgi:hypothetical protein